MKSKLEKDTSPISSQFKMSQDDFDYWLSKPKLSVDEWACLMIGFHPFNVSQSLADYYSAHPILVFSEAPDLNKRLNKRSLSIKVVIDEFTRLNGDRLYELLLSHREGLRDNSLGLTELKTLLRNFPKLQKYICSDFKQQLDMPVSTSTIKKEVSDFSVYEKIIELSTRDKIKIAVQALGRAVKEKSKSSRPDDLRKTLITGFIKLLEDLELQKQNKRKVTFSEQFFKDCLKGIMEPSSIPLKKNKLN
jgi:hypothetical protein